MMLMTRRISFLILAKDGVRLYRVQSRVHSILCYIPLEGACVERFITSLTMPHR